MKDIQFDLEKWQTGKYDVFTLEEKEVKQLTCFELSSHTLLVGIFDDRVCDWNTGGAYLSDNSSHRIYDLFLRPQIKTRWHNVYEGKYGFPFVNSHGYDTKEDAIVGVKNINAPYIKTIAVTNERE